MSFNKVFTNRDLSQLIFRRKFNNSDTYKNITINKKNLIEELKIYTELRNRLMEYGNSKPLLTLIMWSKPRDTDSEDSEEYSTDEDAVWYDHNGNEIPAP
jgi:hypothetical protein